MQRFPAIVVWIPILASDDLRAALRESEQLVNARAAQFWDGDRKLGREIARSLGTPEWTAWDIYLFYPPGAEWTDRGLPPAGAALAQIGGVVVGSKGTLPPLADQSDLPELLRDRAEVVGAQSDLDALLAQVAAGAAQRHPRR